MSKRSDLAAVFYGGAFHGGWSCSDCRREFRHNGRTVRTFARTFAHIVRTHRRLPSLGPSWTPIRWEWVRGEQS